MKKLLAILFISFICATAAQAQQVNSLPLPKTVKEQPDLKKQLEEREINIKCAECDLSKAKYFAMVDGVPFEISPDKPLPFPSKWVKDASIMQKLTGFEVLLNVRESRERKVMELMQSKRRSGSQ